LRRFKPRLPPALVLFLLSPAIGELLSGSSPPSEFFTPFGFTIMALLYGGGALTARELKVRWGRGMGSLLLLGAAYGVLEEGLMVASFQNPGWLDLGVLGVFGRWLGVNWVWAAELTAYHAVVSIVVPVTLVELAYPERRAEPWLGGRWLKIVPGLLVSDVVFGLFLFSAFTGFRPPLPQYSLFVLLTAALVLLARRLPPDWARRGTRPMHMPRFYGLVAALAAIACGAVFWVLPNALTFQAAPILVILLGSAVVLGTIGFLRSHDWRAATPIHRFALVAGALVLFVAFAFFQELDKSRPDDTKGMALVGLVSLIGLICLWRSVKKRVEL
jgi:hypothetical protein